MLLTTLVTAALLHTSLHAPSADSLKPVERAIMRAVDRRTADAITLLERLVNTNSGTMNFAGVRQVGAMLRVRLDSLGFRTRWVEGTSVGRAGHLVAEHPGPGPKLLRRKLAQQMVNPFT